MAAYHYPAALWALRVLPGGACLVTQPSAQGREGRGGEERGPPPGQPGSRSPLSASARSGLGLEQAAPAEGA